MKTITPILEKILFFSVILLILSAFVFSDYIQTQSNLDMLRELEEIVDKEIQEIRENHGKRN